MDKYVAWVNETKIKNTIKSLENNNMKGYLANNKDELIKIIDELTNEGDTVSCGGSMTLFEAGVIDYLRSKNIQCEMSDNKNVVLIPSPFNTEEDFKILKDGFQLLEYDYLGGNGSRGYGRVKISNLQLEVVVGDVDDTIMEKCQKIMEC